MNASASLAPRAGRGIVAGFVLLGLSGSALSSELSENWRIDTQIGRLWPAGRIRRTFGEGFLAGWTVGRRLSAHVIVEGGVRLGSMRYTAAHTVTDTTCLPGARGFFVCTTGPVMQEGSSRDFFFGASGPVKTDRHGRALEIGTGVIFSRYSISPGGESLGSRHGTGVFGKLAADLFPIGTLGVAGIVFTGTHVYTGGASLGTTLPARTRATWLDASLLIQVGRGRRRGQKRGLRPPPDAHAESDGEVVSGGRCRARCYHGGERTRRFPPHRATTRRRIRPGKRPLPERARWGCSGF